LRASAPKPSPPVDIAARPRHIWPIMETAKPLRIDVVSDVVCPWCFIGKRRLEKAVALTPDIPVEIYFHPYFLNDWIPREGIPRMEYLTRKFGSVEAYRGMAAQVAEAAAQEGLTYAIDKIARQPNTLDSHRLIHWAELQGKGPAMKQRLMDLYFTEGADLTDREVLVRAAADIGLDADEVRTRLATKEDVAETTQAADAAKQAGINGVPTFIIDGRYAVSGAQAPESLAELIRKAATES
jgi:predicted DsbA family dithiol-disulfide isomerase